ncbi:hypothetical protein DL769_004606 [Monosporascus sp. CRB-8-3]|nr:hypothetical protein DL769_004606 [Monosporascus sp. CRB-8-3]
MLEKIRQHQCAEHVLPGQLCGKTFASRWNLKRHIQTQHHQKGGRIGGTSVIYTLDYGRREEFAAREADSDALWAAERKYDECDKPAKRQRLGRSRFREVMPAYDVKLSRQFRPQQRAIEWLSYAAKEAFDARISDVLRRWGVRPGYAGTCVVWPRDWSSLDVNTIIDRLTPQSYPLIDSDLALFMYSDHHTSLARAAAWFGQWPRSGIQLDNLLECGPFQRMDASHLCHTPLCVNPSHIVFEHTEKNQDRRECQERARFLRSDSRDVAPLCDKHDPPSRGAVYLRAVPRWHPFPTFETGLPLRFVAGQSLVVFEEKDAALPSSVAGVPKPRLICSFCPRLKSFRNPAPLWSHIVHKHQEKGEDEKLRTIRDTAAVWKNYVEVAVTTFTYARMSTSSADTLIIPTNPPRTVGVVQGVSQASLVLWLGMFGATKASTMEPNEAKAVAIFLSWGYDWQSYPSMFDKVVKILTTRSYLREFSPDTDGPETSEEDFTDDATSTHSADDNPTNRSVSGGPDKQLAEKENAGGTSPAGAAIATAGADRPSRTQTP